MITLSDAHQQFIGHLKGKSRATATILAYGKDIQQLVEYIGNLGKADPTQVTTEDLQLFMDKLSKFENKPPRILSKLEYRALRDAARAYVRMLAVIELLLQTGVRIGELAQLRVED